MTGINEVTLLLVAALLLFLSCVTGSGRADMDGLSLDEAVEQSAAEIAEKLPAGTRVAIVAFEAEHESLAAYIMDELTGVLANGSLEVADRNNLPYVFEELNFQMSGVVDDESAAGIGKFLGAAYVITGQLVNTGGTYRYRLAAVSVESAVQEVSQRHTVRNDRAARNLVAALEKNKQVTHEAAYEREEKTLPATAGTFLDRGIMFAMQGDYEMAAESFSKAITLNPDLYSAYLLRGRALFASISEVTDVGKNFSGINTAIKASAPKTQQVVSDQAIADFSQAIKLKPDSTKAYAERGAVYLQKGDYDRAIADFSHAVSIDPNNAVAYSNRGVAYCDKGDYDRAIADCSQAIKLDPNAAGPYHSRGNAYYKKGDFDQAIADYSQAIKNAPNIAVYYNNRALVYYQKGDYDRAIADYTQTLKLNLRETYVYFIRGLAYYQKGDYDRAIADFSQTVKLDPNNQDYKDALEYAKRRGR